MTLLTLRYDLRVPALSPASHADQYAAALDQAGWADDHGFATVVLSEHHGVDDGFLPSPLVIAAAIAGRTRRILINIAAVRAARLRLPFMPAVGDPALAEAYRRHCADEGFAEGWVILPSGPGFVHVSEDPERDWARIAPYALYDAQTYHAWQTPGQRSQVHVEAADLAQLKGSGVYRVVTPAECLGLATEVDALVFHPLMGGMPADLGWESLECFAAKVAPHLPVRDAAG
ncbi:MAG: LLM class flavin-dependent oxidoreductase [Mycobacteriales bacterium]